MLGPFITCPEFDDSKNFQNIAGKAGNAGNQNFVLFPQYFLSYERQILCFELHLICRPEILKLDKARLFLSHKG